LCCSRKNVVRKRYDSAREKPDQSVEKKGSSRRKGAASALMQKEEAGKKRALSSIEKRPVMGRRRPKAKAAFEGEKEKMSIDCSRKKTLQDLEGKTPLHRWRRGADRRGKRKKKKTTSILKAGRGSKVIRNKKKIF